MSFSATLAIALAERSWVSDSLIRYGIRKLCKKRLHSLVASQTNRASDMGLEKAPIAVETEAANRQHYELPPAFFETVLGKHRKYSCCYWDTTTNDLNQAEHNALSLTCEHAQLEDGMTVLDLGCGWGSLTEYIATYYPNCKIMAVSNSTPQRHYIESLADRKGFGDRVQVQTADINTFQPNKQFDRIISVEMFEHVSNHHRLFQRINNWLHPDGKLLVHIFCHQDFCYPFEITGPTDWMAEHFFTGGMMPAFKTLPAAAEGFDLADNWTWDGLHYKKTSDSWLAKMDSAQPNIMQLFKDQYQGAATQWWGRWRMFFLSVSELFGFQDGKQWQVAHFLFNPGTSR